MGYCGNRKKIKQCRNNAANLAEYDRGAVAHAEQEKVDEDGDGPPEPIQLPLLGLSRGLVQSHL